MFVRIGILLKSPKIVKFEFQFHLKHYNLSEKNKNWFVRIGLIFLLGLIILMIVYKFFYNEPIGEVSLGIIILLAFAIILALSESFDNFSIGKILTLSRTLKEKEFIIEKKSGEIKQAEIEKRELLTQIISLTNSFSQKQSNTNIYGIPPETIQQFVVQQVEKPEADNIKQTEQEEQNKVTTEKRRIDSRKLEEIAFQYFIKENNVDVSKMFKEVKLKAFDGIDPISDTSPIYDGYINDIDKEIFVEIKQANAAGLLFTDRLYIMLSKIYYYRQFKKSTCYLNLVLVEFPEPERDNSRYINRIFELYGPALSSGLLKITTIRLQSVDMAKIYREE